MIADQGDKLVFLLSVPRAGSTLLSLLLGNHPDIVCPPEPWIQLSLAELVPSKQILRVPIDEDVATVATGEFLRAIAAEPQRSSKISGALKKLFSSPIDITQVRQFGTTVYDQVLAMSGKRVFADKTPRYYHVLEFLDEAYPAAKKIVLQRNPLDIAASYKSTWNIPIDELVGSPATANTLDFAKGLFELERYGLQNRSDVEIVAYEDLVFSPEDTLGRICDFLGIPYALEMLRFHENSELLSFHKRSHVGDRKALNAGRRLDTSSVGKWKSQLSDDEVTRLVLFLGRDVFARLGYQDVFSTPNTSQHETLEREANERRAGVIAQLSVSTQHTSPLDRWAYLLASSGVATHDITPLLRGVISTLHKNGPLEDGIGETIIGLASRYKRMEDDRRQRFDAIEELTKALVSASDERSKYLVAIDELTAALKRDESERDKTVEQLRMEEDRATRDRAAYSAELARIKKHLDAISADLHRADAERTMYASEARQLTEVVQHAEVLHSADAEKIGELRAALAQVKQEYEETHKLTDYLFDILARPLVQLALKFLGIAVPVRTKSSEKSLKS